MTGQTTDGPTFKALSLSLFPSFPLPDPDPDPGSSSSACLFRLVDKIIRLVCLCSHATRCSVKVHMAKANGF